VRVRASVPESVRMSLSSVGNPAWETIRGVRFAMLYGPTLVAILVTHAALDDIERAPPGVGGRLACFNKHRDALELAASAKHQRGQHDESQLRSRRHRRIADGLRHHQSRGRIQPGLLGFPCVPLTAPSTQWFSSSQGRTSWCVPSPRFLMWSLAFFD
jgi:hypothetical protein